MEPHAIGAARREAPARSAARVQQALLAGTRAPAPPGPATSGPKWVVSYSHGVQHDGTAANPNDDPGATGRNGAAATGRDDAARARELIGGRLRDARLRRGLGVRELGRQLECSASLISQIEHGRVVPSVSTLYALTNVLGVSMDSLFVDESSQPCPPAGAAPDAAHPRSAGGSNERSIIQRSGQRRAINLERGVRWELLMPTPEPNAEFMEVFYEVGGGSSVADHSIRHNGREYSLVLEGRLSVQIGFEEHLLCPGDSLAFDSTIPHRFWNAGDVTVRAVWFVLDRWAT